MPLSINSQASLKPETFTVLGMALALCGKHIVHNCCHSLVGYLVFRQTKNTQVKLARHRRLNNKYKWTASWIGNGQKPSFSPVSHQSCKKMSVRGLMGCTLWSLKSAAIRRLTIKNIEKSARIFRPCIQATKRRSITQHCIAWIQLTITPKVY